MGKKIAERESRLSFSFLAVFPFTPLSIKYPKIFDGERLGMAVFILENVLSVKTDNASMGPSMAVFILRTPYPSGRIWANICSSPGYEC